MSNSEQNEQYKQSQGLLFWNTTEGFSEKGKNAAL